MISRAELKSLQEHREYPSVSILAPTHRTAPANKQDPIKVKNLVRKAVDRLQKEFSKREVAGVVKNLQQLVKDVDWKHTLDGLALFAGSDLAVAVKLPFKVKPRVLVDETFATRDVVYTYNRARPYRVLSLGQTVRLYDAWTTILEEHLEAPFPLEYRAGSGKKLSRRQVMQRTSARGDDQRKFYREVDSAVAAVHNADPRPLVVTGVERNLAYYREVTKLPNAICGMLAGNHEQTPPDKLGKLVWPVYEVEGTRLRAEALVALDEAADGSQLASGIGQVWRAAVEGQIRTLLVEKEFSYPADVSEDGLQLHAHTGKGAASMDDAVDEAIERVMATGGEVFFYPEGDLEVEQRIAAVLRRKE